MKIIIIGFASLLLLTACGAKYSPKVSVMKPYDKSLSCEEIALERNEAEYVKKMASSNRSSLTNVFRPIGVFGTVSSANDSIDASNNREDYLNSIYQIKQCDNPEKKQADAGIITRASLDYDSEEAQLRRPFTFNSL